MLGKLCLTFKIARQRIVSHLWLAGKLPEGNQPACWACKPPNLLHHLGRGDQDDKPQVLYFRHMLVYASIHSQEIFKYFIISNSGWMLLSMWSSLRLRGRLLTLSQSLTSLKERNSSDWKRWKQLFQAGSPKWTLMKPFIITFLLRFKTRRRRFVKRRKKQLLKEKPKVCPKWTDLKFYVILNLAL